MGLFDFVDLVCGFVNVVGCWGFFFFKGGVGGCGFVSVVGLGCGFV